MYELSFELPGLPPMLNSYSGGHWAKAKRGKWKDYVWLAVRNYLPPAPLKKARLVCIRASSSMPDYDGLVTSFKGVIDGLVESGVIEDDSLKHIGVPEFGWRKAERKKGFVYVQVAEVL
jgi:hypothetical protein